MWQYPVHPVDPVDPVDPVRKWKVHAVKLFFDQTGRPPKASKVLRPAAGLK